MREESKTWRFWGILLGLLGILWAWMAILIVRDDGPGIHRKIWLLVGSYFLITIVVFLGARFQISELRANDEHWKRIDARIRKWTQAVFGGMLVADALEAGTRISPGQSQGRSLLSIVLWMALYFCLGIYLVWGAFRTKRVKTVSD
jgi:hypothetical protein